MDARQPKTIEELQRLLQTEGPLFFIAGGTDLVLRMNSNWPEEGQIIDLSHLDPIKSCVLEREGLKIGAAMTMTEICESELVSLLCPCLAAAASVVGSTQIRNRATLGGNFINAAQCADTIPALISLEAQAEIMNEHGVRRQVPVASLLIDINKTGVGSREVVLGFHIPNEHLKGLGAYAKIGARKAVTIAKINCALYAAVEDGVITKARASFGSLGPCAFHSEMVSKAFEGKSIKALRDWSEGHFAAGLSARQLESTQRVVLDQSEEIEQLVEIFVKQVEAAIPTRDSRHYKKSAVKAVAASLIDQIAKGGER